MAEPAKFDMARRIAAALCYIGLAHLDRLTILPFGRGLGHESSPGRGKGRIFRVFDALEQLEAAGPTDLRESCKAFASRPRQLGLVVIISDRLSSIRGGFEAGLKILRTLGHDVFAVHVTSERDRDPGALGNVRFVDAETGEMREIEVTPRLAAAYVQGRGGARRGARALLRPLRHRLRRRRCGAAVRRRHPARRSGRDGSSHDVRAHWRRGRRWLLVAARPRWRRRCSSSSCVRRAFSCPSLSLWQRVLDASPDVTRWERIRRAVSLVVTVADCDARWRSRSRGRARIAGVGHGRAAAGCSS